ncbi:MAG TPA: CarD family transcriptional regulator [Polyangia bacterium]|nr:CarD family transcriptional regulator [Polyangia bacterium]
MASGRDYKKGDKAVYPAHGVGEVIDIQVRSLGGTERLFYVLSILENGMKVMVPVETAAQAGLRPVMSRKDAKKVMEVLAADEVAVKTQPWNRRYREYMEMLKSGSPMEVAKVLRDLFRLKSEKDLSFGERRLLDTARALLVTELALAFKVKEQTIENQIQALFQ